MPGLAASRLWMWQQPPLPHFYCRVVGRPNFNTVLGLPANSLLSSPLQMLVLFLLGLF